MGLDATEGGGTHRSKNSKVITNREAFSSTFLAPASEMGDDNYVSSRIDVRLR